MQTSLPALVAIIGMAFVTYLTRISGLWLMSRVTLSQRLKAWLGYIPGTVVVSLVAPTIFGTGFAEIGASLATVLVAIRTRNILLSMTIGVGVVWGLRVLLAGYK